MRPVGNHVHASILRAIALEAETASDDREKPILVIEEIRMTDWASATFVGARHEIDLRLEGNPTALAAAVGRLTARLPERDIPIIGHIVAEIAVTPINTSKQKVNIAACHLTVNVLTITD